MNRIVQTQFAVLALVTLMAQPAVAKDRHCTSYSNFSDLSMRLEQNATDGDSEVVLFAKGQDDGLKRLLILGPNGQRIADFVGNKRGIGIREFNLESAEPRDLSAVLASFPEGNYSFLGRSVIGECLKGSTFLSHQVAPATVLLLPRQDQIVSIDQLVLNWQAVANAERYVVELNNENTGSRFTFEILPPTTSLAIPAHMLKSGSLYQYVVGVKTDQGNLTSVELSFSIAP